MSRYPLAYDSQTISPVRRGKRTSAYRVRNTAVGLLLGLAIAVGSLAAIHNERDIRPCTVADLIQTQGQEEGCYITQQTWRAYTYKVTH
jgi:hypothetical protein